MRHKLIIFAAALLIAAVALFVYADTQEAALQQQIEQLQTEVALLDADTHAVRQMQEAEQQQVLQLEQEQAVQKERYDAIYHFYQQFREATAE
ncbi:MAG: hypothetical protein IJC70_07035 [Firmicutes bacterium]|nr:hypothetical protein [Bacillota bacterium]